MANTRFKTHHGLNATANSYIDGKLEVTGDLVVSGNVSVSGSSVGDFRPDADQRNLGNTSLRWNLIGFAANLASTLTANGATTLSNTLLTTGAATFQNTVTVAGVTNVSSNVNILGVTSISNNLIVTGTGTVNGTFTANGNTSFTSGLLTVNNGTGATVTVGAANVSIDSGSLFIDAVNNRVGINNTAPGVALRVTGAVDISSTANVQGNANVGGSFGVAGVTTLGGNATLSGVLQTIGGNVNFDSGVLFVDSVNNRVGINNTTPTVALEIAGSANVTTNVNSALFTVGSNFIANSTAIVGTGYANVTTSVNSASLTVGTNFIANTTGAYHTGVVNAASHTTTGVTANVSGVYPTSNTVGTALGSSTNRWVITANTGDFSTSVGISTINSTSNGFYANSTTASLGNATDNVSISYAGIVVSGADGITPYSNIKGSVLGTSSKRWNLYATDGDFSGNVTIGGNLTVTGTTTYINTTNLNVGDNIVVLNADVTNVTAPTENAGLEINRGSSANVSFLWNETTDAWNLGNAAVSGTLSTSGALTPSGASPNTVQFGNTTARWVVTANSVAANSLTITGSANVSTGVNSSVFTVGSIGASNGFIANSTTISVGNSTSNIQITSLGAADSYKIDIGNIDVTTLTAYTATISDGMSVGGSLFSDSNLVVNNSIQANGSVGTSGQVLLSGGASSNLYWGSASVFTNDLTINQSSPAIYFNDTDNITATANAMYAQFNAGSFTLVQSTDGTAANTRFTFAMTSGNLTIDGELSATSDERKKSNIVTVDSALDKVDSMRGVYFNRNDREGRHVGVIAQEIQKVLPEVVSEDADGYLSVSYGNIVGVLIEAIKELKQEIEELKNGNKS